MDYRQACIKCGKWVSAELLDNKATCELCVLKAENKILHGIIDELEDYSEFSYDRKTGEIHY